MKSNVLAGIVALIFVGGAILYASQSPSQGAAGVPVNNVSIVDGKQIVEVYAKGGYSPRKSIAKAGMPTILRFNTNGTYDCSSSVRIPSMGISTFLPPSGATDIDLGSPLAPTLQVVCGMGMYSFEIEFQS